MNKQDKLWQSIEKEIELYDSLKINESIDYEKFYIYSIITHSTAIEGSTLTELDTQLLFDEGITAKGKPLVHHLMNEDLRNAYVFALTKAKERTLLSPDFLKELNALVMKSTGSITNVLSGAFDSSKGDFRLCGVTAGYGRKSYMNYQKAPDAVSELCNEINKRLNEVKNWKEIYHLSFDAHLNLATIHPWVDGNGRTSRLLMNYLQSYHQAILTKVYKEDRAEYIASLKESQEKENIAPFREFMAQQFLKMLKETTTNYINSQKKNFRLLF
jgi:Fic family protein